MYFCGGAHSPRQEKCGWNIWTSLPAPFSLLPSLSLYFSPTHPQPVGLVGEKGLGLGLSFLSFISAPVCWVTCLTGGLQLSPFALACWEGFIQKENCWWSQIHIMSYSTSSWKPGILMFNYLISSVMFLNAISSQRGSELLFMWPSKSQLSIMGSVWIT